MKEVTRVMTVQITNITCIEDGDEHLIAESKSQEVIKNSEKEFKDWLEADDVKIVNIQDFIMEKDDGKDRV